MTAFPTASRAGGFGHTATRLYGGVSPPRTVSAAAAVCSGSGCFCSGSVDPADSGSADSDSASAGSDSGCFCSDSAGSAFQ